MNFVEAIGRNELGGLMFRHSIDACEWFRQTCAGQTIDGRFKLSFLKLLKEISHSPFLNQGFIGRAEVRLIGPRTNSLYMSVTSAHLPLRVLLLKWFIIKL